ncbi:MAG: hypothetical protein GXO87_04430, partial [Chlorobi bacterium]|nr:hypothetical protein [Chlorobiota bacterium]
IEYSDDRVLKTVAGTGEILFGGKVRAKINVTDAGGLSQIDITVHENEYYPGFEGGGIVKRWFDISSTGENFTFDITLSYKDSELAGEQEDILSMNRWDGTVWSGILNTSSRDLNDNWLTVDGQTEFGDWILDDDWLPVELTSFTASYFNDVVELNWRTATETNNSGFEIQRASSSTTPRQGWETIGFVEGNGTTAETHNYSFIDENVASGKYFYRLKQIDNNGSFEYSDVVEIEMELPSKFELSRKIFRILSEKLRDRKVRLRKSNIRCRNKAR